MIRQTVFAATLALSSLAAPAFAKDAPVPAPAAASEAKPAPAATQRYCVIDTPTGSHLQRKTCKTRAQWLAIGVDPLAKND